MSSDDTASADDGLVSRRPGGIYLGREATLARTRSTGACTSTSLAICKRRARPRNARVSTQYKAIHLPGKTYRETDPDGDYWISLIVRCILGILEK